MSSAQVKRKYSGKPEADVLSFSIVSQSRTRYELTFVTYGRSPIWSRSGGVLTVKSVRLNSDSVIVRSKNTDAIKAV